MYRTRCVSKRIAYFSNKDCTSSPNWYDYAGAVVSILFNWAVDTGHIERHHCGGFKKFYKSDRVSKVWLPSIVDIFCSKSVDNPTPKSVCKILIFALETGLRPADLVRLNHQHIQKTKYGRRIKIETNKRKKVAYIPISKKLGKLIDATPTKQKSFLLSSGGNYMAGITASREISKWRRERGIELDLHLNDARGTAATNLLQADLSLNQIASVMGWGLRYAANVIEHYAEVSGGNTDNILQKLKAAKIKNDREL